MFVNAATAGPTKLALPQVGSCLNVGGKHHRGITCRGKEDRRGPADIFSSVLCSFLCYEFVFLGPIRHNTADNEANSSTATTNTAFALH